MAEKRATKKIKLTNVRMSYAHLIKPTNFGKASEPEKFTARLLMDNKSETLETLNKEVLAFAEDANSWVGVNDGVVPKSYDVGIYEGTTGVEEGKTYINSKTDYAPEVIDLHKNRLDKESNAEELVYSGMHANVYVTMWAYKYNGKCGISFSLGNIQKTKDDVKLSRASAIDEFDFEDEDDLPF